MDLPPNRINGSAKDDILTGTSGGDSIFGYAGNDTLKALARDDYLDGGTGADKMYGGDGNDTYIVDNQADRVIEFANGGIDTIETRLKSVVLSANVENLTFTNSGHHSGTGNGLDNVLTGGAGNDSLDGRGGDDTLYGGAGNDSLVGSDGNDTLFGESGQDKLLGGAGNDVLDGGLSSDVLLGASGNDVYIVDNAKDRVVEIYRGGTDEVRSSVDFKLPANVENLAFTGQYSTNGIGNALDNVMTGNGEKNSLSGLDGDDTLDGGLGNDTLIGGAGADKFAFSSTPNSTSNFDIIKDFSHADGDKIELSRVMYSAFENLGRITDSEFYAAPNAKRAQTADQHLIYDTTSGALYYDGDGAGGRGAIEIAQIGIGLHQSLVFSDFAIIA